MIDYFMSQEVLMLVPFTIGLVEIIKGLGTPARFAPVASVLIGIGLAFFVMHSIPAVILGGIAVGLMASGLYSGVRTMATGQ